MPSLSNRRIFRRCLTAVVWALGIAVPAWLVAALLVDREVADIVGYAALAFGAAVGFNRRS
ncbi:MAG: hypothetical protein QOI76_3175 [Frankiales bacterium]|jgi:hypothetical protein|nr:hypothetical protein [Frankiales bacterium]